MGKRCLWVIALLVLLSLVACDVPGQTVSGSGKVVSQVIETRDFERVEVGGAFRVDIRPAASCSVVVRVDDNLVQCLDVYARSGTLHVGFKPECWIRNATVMEAQITMPALAGLDLSGASNGTIGGFRSEQDLVVEVSGASHLEGDIQAGNVHLNVSGASSVRLSGSGSDLTVEASGASHVDLSDFPVQDASVEVSGASSATVYPRGRLDAEASGASHVYYLGSPTVGRMETSGGSSVQPK